MNRFAASVDAHATSPPIHGNATIPDFRPRFFRFLLTTRYNPFVFIRLLCLVVVMLTAASAQALTGQAADWNRPYEPFHIIANIYYVGPSGLSAHLITTPEGHILIDSGYEQTVPLIRESVTRLGFRFEDVKILLSSHAHSDHVAGHRAVQRQTGARIMAMAGDAEVIEGGGKGDFRWEGISSWPPATVDRVLRDGDTVTLGGVTVTAHLNPGHSKGCTTWTMDITENGRDLQVVFVGGVSINDGVRLVGNPKFPEIADAYARTFRHLKSLRGDVFLSQHAEQHNMHEKRERMKAGAKTNPFIDPQGYRRFVEEYERRYLDQLARERAAR